MAFQVPEKWRVRGGVLGSDESSGNNGMFLIPKYEKRKNRVLRLQCIASDGLGWEHVSISLAHRMPTYREMVWVKKLFWGEDVYVVEFHAPAKNHVNIHPHCRHLWRPIDCELPTPPLALV